MSASNRFDELQQILEALFEDRITPPQAKRLEELTLRDPAARRFYLQYVNLHGNLHWDVAQSGDLQKVTICQMDIADRETVAELETTLTLEADARAPAETAQSDVPPPSDRKARKGSFGWFGSRPAAAIGLAAATLASLAVWVILSEQPAQKRPPAPVVKEEISPSAQTVPAAHVEEPRSVRDRTLAERRPGPVTARAKPAAAAPARRVKARAVSDLREVIR